MTQWVVSRLVIETTSPMGVHTGGSDSGRDTQLVRDMNGLPFIPGTSIAGVWRHLGRLCFDESFANDWFGWQKGQPGQEQGQASRLTISHAVVHNSQNQPVSGLLQPAELQQDQVLKHLALLHPLVRERVRITDRGVAADQGKFDVTLIPAGTRFSLEVKWQQQYPEQQQEWAQLLGLWGDRRMAFGGGTRNGLGQIKVIACETQYFDLAAGPDMSWELQDFLQSPPPTVCELPEPGDSTLNLLADYTMRATGAWRLGSGAQLLGSTSDDGSVAQFPYTEPKIAWSTTGAHLRPKVPVLSGAGVKGLLTHRLLYHYNRLQEHFADKLSEQELNHYSERHAEELCDLLGYANKTDARAGHLFVDDAEIQFQDTLIRHHNQIDRFTGGVRQGALFAEEYLYQPEFRVRIWLSAQHQLSAPVKQALQDTLADMKCGLLPVAAGDSRGGGLTEVVEVHQEGEL